MSIEEIIRKYALQNAIFHDGKADAGAVLSKVIAEKLELKTEIKEIFPQVKEIVTEINSLSFESQKKELEDIAPELLVKEKKEEKLSVLPELKNATPGKVVMRMAPFPSGPLHIGNARMVILNDEYVKKYSGKLYLVFDDTIGSAEKIPIAESYDLIKESLDQLGVKYTDIYYKSDRMELFYDWCEKLIRKGHAYVCECSLEILRKNREDSIECAHRNHSIETNLALWKDMLNGKYKEGEAVVRLKTDMKHKNPAFRDRVVFSVSAREHPKVGKKYYVWPLLEFSWAVDDYLLGITHILRGKDLIIEDEMEKFIWDLFGIKHAEFVHYGMLRVAEAKLSKSKSLQEIKSGIFTGWSDPRTWSLQSLRRRGISAQAIRSFILSFGLSLTDIEVPAESLYAENRKILDASTHRYFFVPAPMEITIETLPKDMKYVEVPNHPKVETLGKRTIPVGGKVWIETDDFNALKKQEIRLKDFCNVILDRTAKFTGKENKEIPRIQWVTDGIKVDVVMPDNTIITGLGEKNLLKEQEDRVIQFERFGFVRIDKVEKNKLICYFAHK